ncbi:MAG: tRNA (adenosine(37)-N6)-dimethylallyltransferase MiaA [Acidobacteriota bacterium]|jgi:tRNA dimethylallyltransferase|nr:tRNA (adenosine(37)-N6)-dimethylallyltransferase MiaA [Acidobacteriota bacterium]
MAEPAIAAVAVVGPTASGKSGLGVALAREFQGEVVGCDALQVYRGLDIGTAKITPAERAGVPHHLIDVAEPDQEFSAGDYQRQARAAIREIGGRGRLPVVVGGTGFYLRALIDGLFAGPGRSEALRARMRAIVRCKGPQALHHALGRIDPEAAARIAPKDADRVIRAYEIYLASGRNMSWWQRQPRDAFAGCRWLKLGIDWPREALYQRINLRVERMFADGLLGEVRDLMERHPPTLAAFKAIGYRQAAAVLEGRMPLAEAVASTQMETRRYAKRQLTWLRADKDVVWLRACDDANDGMEAEPLPRRAATAVRAFLRQLPPVPADFR